MVDGFLYDLEQSPLLQPTSERTSTTSLSRTFRGILSVSKGHMSSFKRVCRNTNALHATVIHSYELIAAKLQVVHQSVKNETKVHPSPPAALSVVITVQSEYFRKMTVYSVKREKTHQEANYLVQISAS